VLLDYKQIYSDDFYFILIHLKYRQTGLFNKFLNSIKCMHIEGT